jgi:hypothetical protein
MNIFTKILQVSYIVIHFLPIEIKYDSQLSKPINGNNFYTGTINNLP